MMILLEFCFSLHAGNRSNLTPITKTDMYPRGVSGSLKVGGQVVIWQLWRQAAAAGGAFYSAKRWGGAIAPLPPFQLRPCNYIVD